MKPNILFIHEKLGFSGGAEKNIFSNTSYLKNYFDCQLLFSSRTGNQEEEFSKNFVKLHQIDFHIECTDDLFSKEKPDLIFLQKCSNMSIIAQCLESRIPVVRMMHDHEIYCLRKSKYFPISREICPYKAGLCCLVPGLAFLGKDEEGALCLKNPHYFEHKNLVKLDQQCDAFFVGSHYMKKELVVQGYSEEKISIYPPVEPFFEEPSSDFSENKILYVGQVLRGKGLDCLIQALKLVKTDFHLQVIGNGSFLDHCKWLAKNLSLEGRIEFAGFVNPEDMSSFYSHAICGVVPSVWPEPFGIVGLEFMRRGLPVVAFDSGGIKDWLQDGINGYLVPHLNIQKMAEKIDLLISDKATATAMGQKGKEILNRNFNFESFMERMASQFNTLIKH